MNNLIKAAQAVCDRWDSPNWKDEAPTAELIGKLREAIAEESEPAPPKNPEQGVIVAALCMDNFDGKAERSETLAYVDKDGVWIYHDSGRPIIGYSGDDVICWWPLDLESGIEAIK